jgi:hypothetical protein
MEINPLGNIRTCMCVMIHRLLSLAYDHNLLLVYDMDYNRYQQYLIAVLIKG